MGYRSIVRLHPAEKTALGRDNDKRHDDLGACYVVLRLGNERWLQRLGAMVVGVIDGTRVSACIIDDMPMDDGSRV